MCIRDSNFICWRGREHRATSKCQIFSKLVYPKQRYCDFSIFEWLPPPSWIFEIPKFYRLTGSRRSRCMHQHAKYSQNLSISCKDIKIFQFFKMVDAAILDFQICKISFADSFWTHHRAKWRQNRSFRCGDIAIFRIFKMAAAAILDFWNHKFYSLLGVKGRNASACQFSSKSVKLLRI